MIHRAPIPLLVHGLMAVMTSPTLEKPILDLKADALAPVDAMAIDSDANG